MATRTLIMAVPWVPQRAVRAKALMEETGGEVVWDTEHNPYTTWRDLLTRAGDEPVIVLEDDIYLCDDWRGKVEAAIAEHPDSVIQFFSLRGAKDAEMGSRWEPGRTYIMNQCHYLPAGAAASLLDFLVTWLEQRPDGETGHDLAIADWMKSTKQRYWLHVPSLVQHEPWRSEIHPRRPRNRQSPSFN